MRRHQVLVATVLVGWVKRVIPQHVERRLRQIWLVDLVDVLVVPPRQMHLVEPAIGLIDAELGLISRDFAIRIGRKVFAEDNLVRPRAADGESVANDRPLRLAVKAENLAEIVNEAGENHPAWMP